jgi:hypothetical protein
MRAVNQDVRKELRVGEEDALPFFCECPDEGCYAPLWLTLGDYDRLAAGSSFGIADRHTFAALSTDLPG